jgi:hypothetical protein
VSRDYVRKLIEKHYSKDITVIHFTGWDSCEKSTADVTLLGITNILVKQNIMSVPRQHISLTANYEGRSSIGMSAFDDDNNWSKGVQGSQKLILKNLNIGTILHEFGHLAGLRHEHPRSITADSKPNCLEYVTNEKSIAEEELSSLTSSYTNYDDFSIMNYCYIFNFDHYNKNAYSFLDLEIDLPYPNYVTINENQSVNSYNYLLSLGDIHSLNCLYKKYSDEYCHEDYNPKESSDSKLIYNKYLLNK